MSHKYVATIAVFAFLLAACTSLAPLIPTETATPTLAPPTATLTPLPTATATQIMRTATLSSTLQPIATRTQESTLGATPTIGATALDLSNVAWAEIKVGKYDDAITHSTRAMSLDPKFVDAYYIRAIAHQLRGDPDLAGADCTKAIQIDQNPAAAYVYLCMNWAIIPTFGQSLSGPFFRGAEYYRQKKYDDAIAEFTKAIEDQPTNAMFYLARGLAYRQKGLKPQAIADFEMFLRVHPTEVDTRAIVERMIRELQGQ